MPPTRVTWTATPPTLRLTPGLELEAPYWRRSVGEADVLTVNIGLNDLGRAAEAYENGTCGGGDNQDCLRKVVETVEGNWNAIIAELLSLRSTNDTIIRTAGLGYTPYLDTEEPP